MVARHGWNRVVRQIAREDLGKEVVGKEVVVVQRGQTWKEREDVVDDITCVVVFMDIKLVEKSLKFKE